MKIHEFQGKEILRQYGVAVPEGGVAHTPEEAEQIAEKLGYRLVDHRMELYGVRLEREN